MHADMDRVNRRVYASRGALRQYGTAAGWLDAGERAAVMRGASGLNGGPILDIGVGGGRTAPLLHALGGAYTGVDYTPDLVARARQRFPDLDLREMDARRLDFPDASFALVVFSYNGIDSVDLAGRARVLHEVYRVLAPGGAFVFSSLNREGRAYGERPWVREQHWKGLGGLLRLGRRTVMAVVNRMRHRALFRDEGDIALAPIAVHNFGLVTVFTSMTAQIRQLEAAGFTVEAVLDDASGQPASEQTDHRRAPWFYYVARKPSAEVPTVASPADPPAQAGLQAG